MSLNQYFFQYIFTIKKDDMFLVPCWFLNYVLYVFLVEGLTVFMFRGEIEISLFKKMINIFLIFELIIHY